MATPPQESNGRRQMLQTAALILTALAAGSGITIGYQTVPPAAAISAPAASIASHDDSESAHPGLRSAIEKLSVKVDALPAKIAAELRKKP